MASGEDREASARASNSRGLHTSEYQAIRDHYGPIIKRLQHVLVNMADEFFSKELISFNEKNDAVGNRQPPYNTASSIMSSIMTKIECDTKWYYIFMEVLQTSELTQIADDIESHRQQSIQEEKYTPIINDNSIITSTPVAPLQHHRHDNSSQMSCHPSSTNASEFDSAFSELQTDFKDNGDEIIEADEDKVEKKGDTVEESDDAHPPVRNSSSVSSSSCIPQQPEDKSTEPAKSDLEVGNASSNYTSSTSNVAVQLAEAVREKKFLEAEIECQRTKHKEEIKEKTRELEQTVKEKDETIEKLEQEINHLKSDKQHMMESEHNGMSEPSLPETEYQAKITSLNEQIASLTDQLEKAEKEKIDALAQVESLTEQLKTEKYETQISLERMNTKMAKLELEKEKEISGHKAKTKNQEIRAEKNEKEKVKAELKIKEMENDALQKQLKELRKQSK